MTQASFQVRKFAAISLTSLYSLTASLSYTALLWGMGFRTTPAAAQNPALEETTPPNLDTQGRDRTDPIPVIIPADPTEPLVSPYTEVAPSTNATQKTPFDLYRLGPGDTISVIVQRFPDLSFQASINPEGNVVAPLLGTIPLQGLTLEETQERVRLGLSRYVNDPIVTVALGNQRPVQVTIMGEVVKPGFYPIAGGLPRVSAALLSAGGTTNRADLRNIRVRRSLIDGSVIEQEIDLFTPLKNGEALPDLRLEDGDAIIVPQIAVGTAEDYDPLLISRSTLSQQTITIRVLSYAAGRNSDGRIGTIQLANGSGFVDALAAISPDLRSANLKKIALIRFDPEQGKAITREINGRKAIMGDVSQNVPLQNNDVIVVGRNLIGRITYALNTFTQPFRDVLGFLLFFDELSTSASDLFGPGDGNEDEDE